MKTTLRRDPARSAGGYAEAVLGVAVALGARWLLDPVLGDHLPYPTFFVAVILAAWRGGFRPALLATVLGLVASLYFFVPPRFSFHVASGAHWVGLAMYTMVGLAIAAFGERMRAARRRFEEVVSRQGGSSRPWPAYKLELGKSSLGELAVIGFALTVAVLVVGGTLGFTSARRLEEDTNREVHTHEVLQGLQGLLSTIQDAETGQRGYLLAGEESYLQPYDDAVRRIRSELDHLREITSDDPVQRARLSVLERKVAARIEELTRTVSLMKSGDRPAALEIVHSDVGRELMDETRGTLAGMQQAERDLLRRRGEESEASALTLILSIEIPAVLGIVLVCFAFYLSQRNAKDREWAAGVLADQREQLRVTLASIGDAVLTTDAEGRVTYLNPVAESLTSWTHAEAAGKPLEEIFHIVNEETRRPVENPALRALREGVAVGMANHTVLLTKDGAERPIDDSAAPIRDEEGRVTGVVLVFRDVTPRRLAEREKSEIEAALRRSEARTSAVVSSALDAIITMNHAGQVVEFNPAAERMFGYTREEVLGREMAALIIPEVLRESHRAGLARCVSTGEGRILGQRIELDALHSSGREFPVELAIARIEQGGLPLFSGTIRDITARKEAEEALREGERRLRFVLDSMPQKIFTATPEGTIDYFNPQWIEFTGLPFERIEDREWDRFVHPEDLAENRRVWRRSIETSEPFHFEHRIRRADGEYRWHVVRALAMRDEEGRIDMWIGSISDIHEQKQTANQLRQYAAELSEADRRKNEFLAMLAHELRNPLAPLRNAAQIVRRTSGDPEALHSASTMMERQIGQMVRLVDDLLDVSRISRGKIELRRGRVELASVVNQAVEAARSLVEEKEHELVVAMPPRPIFLDADPIRLAQVLGNLLNNACKYTSKGGRITLTIEEEAREVVIRVRDTGIGIAADQLRRIFEMFVQVDTSLERTGPGLGIGLTLVKSLVEMHAGTVEVHSAGLGQGSEFVVRLPMSAETEAPKESRTPVSLGKEAGAAAPRRFLVVDDNHDSADSLAMLLRMRGHEVSTAYDGLEALAAVEATRPAVVLLDIGLPRLNGYEVARRIRSEAWGRDLVLVALTGWGQEQDRLRAREVGFDAHMSKPIEFAALERLLAGLKGGERGG